MSREVIPLVVKELNKNLRKKVSKSSWLLTYWWLSQPKKAPEVVLAFETLTLQEHLWLLTLLPLGRCSPFLLDHALCEYRTWCPACLQEWQNAGRTIHEPLLWSLRSVTVCPYHKQRLHSRCVWCDGHQTIVSENLRVGYCSKCQNWLGIPLEMYRGHVAEEEIKQQAWLNEFLRDLLIITPVLNTEACEQIKSSWDNIKRIFRRKFRQTLRRGYAASELLKKQGFEEFVKYCYSSRKSAKDLLALDQLWVDSKVKDNG
jgi:hypothetical protein